MRGIGSPTLIGALGMLLAAAGCADGSSNLARDITGTVIGPATQRDVNVAESQVFVGGSGLAPTRRRTRTLIDRYDEIVSFDVGWVRYEKLYSLGGFSGNATNIGAIQSIVDTDFYRNSGLQRAVQDVSRVVNRYGIAQYATLENAQWRCAVFAEYFWTGATTTSATSPGNTELRGQVCIPTSDRRAAELHTFLRALLTTIQVGEGINRGAATQEAAAPLPAPAPPAAPSLVAAATPLGTPFEVAAPGTRFVANDGGYFQIVRVEGHTVVTVNAGNQTARWTAGILNARSGSTIDLARLEALFPLAVGKQAEFDETSGNDRWHYTIKVLRTEAYLLKGRSYDTFVVEVRDQSVNPDQGGFDRTRTYWYSRELGGILRLRATQASGPQVRLPNWDIVEVVPPKSS